MLLETTLGALGDKIKAVVETGARNIRDIKDKITGLQKDIQNSRTKTPKGTPTGRKRLRISASPQSPKVISNIEDGSFAKDDLHDFGLDSTGNNKQMQTPKSPQNTQAE